MTKKRLENALKLLRSLLRDDSDALNLIDQVEERAQGVDFKTNTNESNAGGHY